MSASARRFASRQRQITGITSALAADPRLGAGQPAPRGFTGTLRAWADRVLADPEAAAERTNRRLGCGKRQDTIESVRMDVVAAFRYEF